MRFAWGIGTAAISIALAAPAAAEMPGLARLSLAEIAAQMRSGTLTSAQVTQAYLDRIAAMDRKGPSLRAVISTNPDALAQARASDARRKAGHPLSALDGVPILVKDNIETLDPMPTTAGSLALKDNVSHRDAPMIARLRAAGVIVLGKTNLSEWANIRSDNSMSGWSAVGGLVRNPHALDRTSCGSSSGTGAGVAASFAAAGIGTETNGSIVCPTSMNGLVGLKPTVGMVSRTHIVPISHSQDTAGPMGRSVTDVAMLFSAMVGSDPADPATAGADKHRANFAASLGTASLKGVRIGVIRPRMSAALGATFDAALAQLRAAGAVLVDVTPPKVSMGDAELTVLLSELHVDLDAYLASTPPTVKTRSLADVIAFDKEHAAEEMPYFGQELFEKAAGMTMDDAYRAALQKAQTAAKGALDTMMQSANVTLLVEPTAGAAWLSDPVHGDQGDGPSASGLPAISGYPHLSVPMGKLRGLPVGLSFIGPAYSEQALLNAGYVFEQTAKVDARPGFAEHADAGPGVEGVR